MGTVTRRLLPHPCLTLAIAAIWVLLAGRPSIGAVALGLVLGLLVPALTQPFWPDRPRLGRPLLILRYVGIVLWDIAVANVQVARIVLFVPNRELRSAYVVIPLALTSPEAIAVLAGTITMTPGTLSAELSADGRALLVAIAAGLETVVRVGAGMRYPSMRARGWVGPKTWWVGMIALISGSFMNAMRRSVSMVGPLIEATLAKVPGRWSAMRSAPSAPIETPMRWQPAGHSWVGWRRATARMTSSTTQSS